MGKTNNLEIEIGEARAKIGKMRLKRGDILLIRTDDKPDEQMVRFIGDILNSLPVKAFGIVLGPGEEATRLTDDALREMGLRRI